jgi:SAM-dependent methyltransferase
MQDIKIILPDDSNGLSQDEEYCLIVEEGQERKIRFHDYHEIYKIPGLYEHVFYKVLKCDSPNVVTSMLVDEVSKSGSSLSDLVVLDIGAGNGLVGEALSNKGVGSIIGVDIIDEAAEAAQRDRPDVYENYFIEDLCNLDSDSREILESSEFNCLTCVAALGFDDIPPAAFASGYNLLSDDAWVAFNIKEDFISDSSSSGFSGLIDEISKDGIFEIKTKQTYQHRLSVNGEPLHYIAIVGKKHAEIPAALI